ncbi:MAG: TetR/AcrR family transcriptional regulator [Deltaproteobacteria bacterium]|nr:TetR/AcrR family transcriptional regulator [Deltaproteobacteria bacterium]MBW2396489.1 TetR/AcrR family transcriptional regulator [Deltaproteobacteria bacterium]
MSRVLSEQAVADFRTKLCRVAARRFAEFGYAGVTLRALSDELGCSRTTPYRYFRDKADILGAVRTQGFRRLAEAEEAAVRAEPDPLLRLQAVGRAYLRFAGEEPDNYRLMFEVPEKFSPAPTAELRAEVQRSQRPLIESVQAAVEAGLIHGSPTTLTHLLWAALHGVASLHLAEKLTSGRTFEELSEAMVTLIARQMQSASNERPSPNERSPDKES